MKPTVAFGARSLSAGRSFDGLGIPMRLGLVISALAVLAPSAALAVSTVTDVTPNNIASQPLTLRVEHEAYDKGAVIVFRIFVSGGKREVSPRHDARFVIWQEKVNPRDGQIHASSSRPSLVAVCSVREHGSDGVLSYEVQVSRELADRSTFTFLAFEPSGMPAFDGYEIILGEFIE